MATGSTISSGTLEVSRGQRSELALAAGMIVILAVLLVPLPTFLIDVLLTVNLSAIILVMLVTLAVTKPLELSVFPSVLLIFTLFRLSLNVATTRLILLQADAGGIVSTFGGYIVGGSLVVGLVMFLILVIIQFVVITRGATRISEVSARFVLDAMPGKQMAIDADLNAGIIDERQGRERRSALMREAEFFGSMDGASKFVRGDAIAGLILTAINLLAGIVIGLSGGLGIAEAVQTYSTLTIGDGLISQIPAMIVATAAGMLTTKASSELSLGQELGDQILTRKRTMFAAAVILIIVSFVPGLPKIPFWIVAVGLWYFARRTTQAPLPPPEEGATEMPRTGTPRSPMETHLEEFLDTDRACVELGAMLIPLVSPAGGVSLLQRIGTLRREVARASGLWVPLIRVRDSAELAQEEYRFLVNGREVGRAKLLPNHLLAIQPEGKPIGVASEPTTDPAFGLPAYWIRENDRARAEIAGCTVVDLPSVLITHLREIVRRYSAELLSREDLNNLVDKVRETSPRLVDELIPNVMTMGTLHSVLTLLLEERVPITNLSRILEALSSRAAVTPDPAQLADYVREILGQAICEPFLDQERRLHAVVLEPTLELQLRQSLHEGKLVLHPQQMEKFIVQVATLVRQAGQEKRGVALLVDGALRRPLRDLLVRPLPDLGVLAYAEVPGDMLLEADATIRFEEVSSGVDQEEPVSVSEDG